MGPKTKRCFYIINITKWRLKSVTEKARAGPARQGAAKMSSGRGGVWLGWPRWIDGIGRQQPAKPACEPYRSCDSGASVEANARGLGRPDGGGGGRQRRRVRPLGGFSAQLLPGRLSAGAARLATPLAQRRLVGIRDRHFDGRNVGLGVGCQLIPSRSPYHTL
jgi:hypothetical protein